ncbi:hypothetical protein KZ829_18480 [Actinoplanes hulinensis]|uniref:Methyltransferase n=1 Tax=Actinoplanes hulinensis TaxID=1144547 RepID=A0ABS7B4D6_9ACTN|nr:hypothetical protein [Actinoplanes hulinensis]
MFLTDREWQDTLTGLYDVLVPGGHLVFETRRPGRAFGGERTKEAGSETRTSTTKLFHSLSPR